MKKRVSIVIAFLSLLLAFTPALAYEAIVGPTGVLKYKKAGSYGGYTLFAPTVGCKTTYLIDMEGNVVHRWESEYPPGLYAVLLPNGNLLRAGAIKDPAPPATIGGSGGIIQEFDWKGELVWEYKLFSPTEIQHHCFSRMPNGNTLILAWEFKSIKEVIAKGRDPKTIPASVFDRGMHYKGFWVDFVREVDKAGKTVWEWHMWDHIGTGPTEFDINFKLPDPTGGIYPNFDWSHFNTVDFIEKDDLILLNSRNFSEFYLVDHKTGKLIYRWGNPSAYGQGKAPSWYDNGDQQIFGSHHATYLGKDRFLIFDNGSERPEGNRSAVFEIDRKTNKIVWEYRTKTSNSFFSYRQGAAQRLPNGNTLITSTQNGHLFEVTKEGEVVWEFVNPVHDGKTKCVIEDGDAKNCVFNMIHRAYRYGEDYPGLQGKNLSKKKPLADCPKFFQIYKTIQ